MKRQAEEQLTKDVAAQDPAEGGEELVGRADTTALQGRKIVRIVTNRPGGMSAANPFLAQEPPKNVFAGVATKVPPGGSMSPANPFTTNVTIAAAGNPFAVGALKVANPFGAMSAANPFLFAPTHVAVPAPVPEGESAPFGAGVASFKFAAPPATNATAAPAPNAAKEVSDEEEGVPEVVPVPVSTASAPAPEELKGGVLVLEQHEMKLFLFGSAESPVGDRTKTWSERGLGVLRVYVIPAEGEKAVAVSKDTKAVLPAKAAKVLITMRTVTMRPILSCLVDPTLAIGAQQQKQVAFTTANAAAPDGAAPPEAPQSFLLRATKAAEEDAVAKFVTVVKALQAALVQ